MAEKNDPNQESEKPPPQVMLPLPRRRPLATAAAGPAVQEGEVEEWMLTYMDLVTLLVVLFVLLLSIATFEPDKRKEIAEGLESQKSGGSDRVAVSVLPPSSDQVILEPWEPTPGEVARELRGAGLPEGVGLEILEDGVRISIDNQVLFPSGSAELSVQGRDLLDHLVGLLRRGAFDISVEGHTDDVPISTPQFPSNWELSSARASGVVRHFVSRDLEEGRFRAIGYAATRPVDARTTADARARNRRVNLMLETGTGG